MPKIVINGEVKTVRKGISLEELVDSLDLASKRLAVELNLNVVRRSDWKEVQLKDDDKIEVVHFVGGG